MKPAQTTDSERDMAAFPCVPQREQGMKRWLVGAGLGMTLALFALFLFTGALHGHFMADDFAYVTFGRALSPVPFLDSLQLYWLPMPKEVGLQFYRPTIGLSYAWDWAWTGWDSFGYRLTNLCLHIGSGWLFLAITWMLTRSVWVAGGACWLFALSPAHPETLLWISSRVNLLATFFTLLALFSHLRRRLGGAWLWTCLTFVASWVALTSKETAVIIAPLLTAYVWLNPPRASMPLGERLRAVTWSTGYLWLLLIPYFALRYHVLGTLGGGYVGEVQRDYFSLDYLQNRMELLRLLASPVVLTSWSSLAKYSLLAVHGAVLIGLVVAVRRQRSLVVFGLVWLAGTMVPIYKAPFTEMTLQDSRLLYEPSLPFLLLIVLGLAGFGHELSSRVRRLNLVLAIGIGLLLVYPVLLWGNMSPWLQMGRVSRSLDEWARASEGEGFEDRWIVDLPVVSDGAYLFLSQAPPFVMLDLSPELRQRLHGLRTTQYGRLLREGSKRSVEGTLYDWDLLRLSSIDGRITAEPTAHVFPLVLGGVEVRWARISSAHVYEGEDVVGQLYVEGQATVLSQLRASVELWLDGERVENSAVGPREGGAGPIWLTPALRAPAVSRSTSYEVRLSLLVGTEHRSLSLGALRVESR